MNNLDQMTIDDYFREFSHFHVKKATELLQPLHTPGQDPLPDFSDATRQPFEPQAHVIAAAIKMLDETRRGMIVSECGTGKTLMGMLTIHQHAQRSVRKGGCNGNYRAIVLCPDHLMQEMESGAGGDDPRRQGDDVRCRRQGLQAPDLRHDPAVRPHEGPQRPLEEAAGSRVVYPRPRPGEVPAGP